MKINLYDDYKIKYCAAAPLELCRVIKPYLLKVNDGGAEYKSVLLFLMPYYCGDAAGGNVSMYAAARDYHLYFDGVRKSMTEALRALLPGHVFTGFADSAPVSELTAASAAGLGVIGRHGLLINPEYSSFCFIGGIYSDIAYPVWGELIENIHIPDTFSVSYCRGCGACAEACPAGCIAAPGQEYDGGRAQCLSAVTQKKSISEREAEQIASHHYVWGCDVCQLCCPYTKEAISAGTIETPIPFFRDNVIKTLDSATLTRQLESGEFARRAYSWRGADTVMRNLRIKEAGRKDEGEDT